MQVRESPIPVHHLYNPQVNKVKDELAVANAYNKEMYLPQEAP